MRILPLCLPKACERALRPHLDIGEHALACACRVSKNLRGAPAGRKGCNRWQQYRPHAAGSTGRHPDLQAYLEQHVWVDGHDARHRHSCKAGATGCGCGHQRLLHGGAGAAQPRLSGAGRQMRAVSQPQGKGWMLSECSCSCDRVSCRQAKRGRFTQQVRQATAAARAPAAVWHRQAHPAAPRSPEAISNR